MKANNAVYLDLFSILAIGVFVLMSVVTGPDSQARDKPSYTVITALFSLPADYRAEHGQSGLRSNLLVEPYLVVANTAVEPRDVGLDMVTQYTIDGLTVLLRGEASGVTVGFKATSVNRPDVVGITGQYAIISRGVRSDKLEGAFTVGRWVDPQLDL